MPSIDASHLGAFLVGGLMAVGVALRFCTGGGNALPKSTFAIEAEMPRIDGLSPKPQPSRVVSGSDMPLVHGLSPGPHGSIRIGPGWVRGHDGAEQVLLGMLVCEAEVQVASRITYRFSPWPDSDFNPPPLVARKGEPHAQYWGHDGYAGVVLDVDDVTRFSPWRQGALAWIADLEAAIGRKAWFGSVSTYSVDGELKSQGLVVFSYGEGAPFDAAVIERAAHELGMAGTVDHGFHARVGRWSRTVDIDREDPRKTYVRVKTTDKKRGATASCQLDRAQPATPADRE